MERLMIVGVLVGVAGVVALRVDAVEVASVLWALGALMFLAGLVGISRSGI